MTEFNFEKDVAIDLDDLHEEWRTHAHVRKKYADEVAYLDKVVKQQNKLIEVKKANLKKVTGVLILRIKSQDTKMTVQQVDATIAGHKELKPTVKDLSDVQDELIEIEYDLNMARNSLKGFDDRKLALENEVKLLLANYWADPREGRQVKPGKRIADIARDNVAGRQRKKLNRKK